MTGIARSRLNYDPLDQLHGHPNPCPVTGIARSRLNYDPAPGSPFPGAPRGRDRDRAIPAQLRPLLIRVNSSTSSLAGDRDRAIPAQLRLVAATSSVTSSAAGDRDRAIPAQLRHEEEPASTLVRRVGDRDRAIPAQLRPCSLGYSLD